MTDYIKQAEKFLKDTNTTMEIIYNGMYSPRGVNTMTKTEYNCIMFALDKDIYLLALYAARQEIKKMTNIK